jgi:hypothetical protein
MSQPVIVEGAELMCSFGAAPVSLIVSPEPRVTVEGRSAATVMDFAPIVNIPPFGMCSSLDNPEVASATAAAGGVLTPQPCEPVIVQSWEPGAQKVFIANSPALDQQSKCMCAWEGVINITLAGSERTFFP